MSGISKRFPGVVALAGQAIGRAVTGKARAGERSYDEAELTRVRQRVGMVFQQFNLFPHMTALGNVMEGLRTVRGQREAERGGHARVVHDIRQSKHARDREDRQLQLL